MLFFDQLKKNDSQLRILAVAILSGLLVLVAGLWWVQIVSARDYQVHQQSQSSRTVRVPAVRGKILDRKGEVLAENRSVYNLSMYLEEFRKPFDAAASAQLSRLRKELKRQREVRQKELGVRFSFWHWAWHRPMPKAEQKKYVLSLDQVNEIWREARYTVSSNTVFELSTLLSLPQPIILNRTNFETHYAQTRAVPFPVITNLSSAQLAIFEEKCTAWTNVDVEMQSVRAYPRGTTAAHLLGYVKRDAESVEGEEAEFSYRRSGFKGQLGIEAGFDKELRGKAGKQLVHVNSLGYRQSEDIDLPAEPGTNVVLTLDLELQEATERALQTLTSKPKAAAVVLDVWTGDILALASKPSYNPNVFLRKMTQDEFDKLNDEDSKPQLNRATRGSFAPGSIFKTVIGLAALEAGLDEKAQVYVPEDPSRPGRGIAYFGRGRSSKMDQVAPGLYDFKRALLKSSNAYFISNGINTGIEKIVALAQHLHLSETTGLPTRQDVKGNFPTLNQVRSGWNEGDTANVCIGASPVLVSPLQMAVLAAAIANGGTVLWPRLVDRLYPADPTLAGQPVTFPKGRIRDRLGVSERSLSILRNAMLADVEDREGTGTAARILELRVCGKTGTAQVQDLHNKVTSHFVWFLSFAPYGAPRYAVVVMIDGGTSGGGDCAPIGGEIYRSIVQMERRAAAKSAVISSTAN